MFAHDILNARPYAFLDDAPLEERRAQAVQTRGSGRGDGDHEAGVLDAQAIASVRDEARPDPRDADELHDALDDGRLPGRRRGARRTLPWVDGLIAARPRAGRATSLPWTRVLVAAERLPEWRAIHDDLTLLAADRRPALAGGSRVDARQRRSRS